jgi:hypothetical protein
MLDDAVNYLMDSMNVIVQDYDSEALGVDMPITVDLKVTQAACRARRHRDGREQVCHSGNRLSRAGAALRQRRGHYSHRHAPAVSGEV